MNKALKIFSDGGARGNPGPAAIGFVVKDENNKVLYQHGECIGKATNNVAEYQGVVKALDYLLKKYPQGKGILKIDFYLDSKLVVNQLNGSFKVKQPHLQRLVQLIKVKETHLSRPVFYHHIPREQNTEADSLLNQALDKVS